MLATVSNAPNKWSFLLKVVFRCRHARPRAQVLNLFLALLLNSFNSDALNSGNGKKASAKVFIRSLRKIGKKAMSNISRTTSTKKEVTFIIGVFGVRVYGVPRCFL